MCRRLGHVLARSQYISAIEVRSSSTSGDGHSLLGADGEEQLMVDNMHNTRWIFRQEPPTTLACFSADLIPYGGPEADRSLQRRLIRIHNLECMKDNTKTKTLTKRLPGEIFIEVIRGELVYHKLTDGLQIVLGSDYRQATLYEHPAIY